MDVKALAGKRRKARMYSGLGVELCAGAIEIGGQRLEPDQSKGYVEFSISHAFPMVTLMSGICLHPGTIGNSYGSMLHQVFNLNHLLRAYDLSEERNEILRDRILGSIVAVEYPPAPVGGWKVQPEWTGSSAPAIRAAAVIHKHAEGVPKILGEHLAGRHRWTVSMETHYDVLDCGFVVFEREKASRAARDWMARTTPEEFRALGLGYVRMDEAPEDLLECYDFNRLQLRPKATWAGSPLALMVGGIGGRVHYQGVGLVRYGKEREAEIAQILARDEEAEAAEREGWEAVREWFTRVSEFGVRSEG